MRFTATKAALASAATDVGRAVANRSSTPILGMYKIAAFDDGRVVLTGYDQETGITAEIDAVVGEPGEVLAPRLFGSFVSSLTPGDVTIEQDYSRLRIIGRGMKYAVPISAAVDYPTLPKAPASLGAVDAESLADAVHRVAFCAREVPGLDWSGLIRLEAGPDEISVLATDRYTVGKVSLPWSGPTETAIALIPGKTLTDALKTLSGPMEVGIDASGLAFTTRTRTVHTRVYDVEFPQVHKVLDRLATPAGYLTVEADKLAEKMAAVAKVLWGGKGSVRLAVDADQITFDVVSEDESTADGVMAHDGLAIEGNGNGDGEIDPVYVNPGWLSDALKSFGEHPVDIALPVGLRAVVITSDAVPGLIHLIQPVKDLRRQ